MTDRVAELSPAAPAGLPTAVTTAGSGLPVLPTRGAGPWTGVRSLGVALAGGWLALIVGCALLADLLPLHNPDTGTAKYRRGPFRSWAQPLGTDALGRDELSRVIYGARVSLEVGLSVAAIAFVIGCTIGVLSGYWRGVLDELTGLATDALLAFPALVFVIALTAVRGKGVSTIVIGLTVVTIPTLARIARGSTIQIGRRDYVTAMRLMGAATPRILLREVVPGVARAVLAIIPVIIGTLILAESGLSYLGLGVEAPTPSWGSMIFEGQSELSESPHLVFVPSAILFLTVLALFTVGDWLTRRITR